MLWKELLRDKKLVKKKLFATICLDCENQSLVENFQKNFQLVLPTPNKGKELCSLKKKQMKKPFNIHKFKIIT